MKENTQIFLRVDCVSSPTAFDKVGMDGLYIKSVTRIGIDEQKYANKNKLLIEDAERFANLFKNHAMPDTVIDFLMDIGLGEIMGHHESLMKKISEE